MITEQNKYIGIDKWHEKGITGKGIVVWNTEGTGDTHSETVTRRIKDSAPDCTVIEASLGITADDSTVYEAYAYYDGIKYDVEDFIERTGISIVTRSIGSYVTPRKSESEYWNRLKDKYNLVFFSSAGNYGEKGSICTFAPDVSMYIGACNLINGNVTRAYYSSIDDDIDFMSFTGAWSGTSFAAPYMAGITALLKQRYGNVSHDWVYQYFVKHSQDLNTISFDSYTGWGLARLGGVEMQVKIKVGDDYMLVDDKKVQLDQPAILQNGRVMLPLRAIGEVFDSNVDWDNMDKVATIKR